MNTNGTLDYRLVHAMRQGVDALPADLERLRSYIRLIDTLLVEKAGEMEASLEAADEAASEIETLLNLEAAVTERAIGILARDLPAVLDKLAIWRTLSPGDAETGLSSPRNRLVLSVEADLERLAGSDRSGSDR